MDTGDIAQTVFDTKISLFLANAFGGGLTAAMSDLIENGSVDPWHDLVAAVTAGAAAPGEVGSNLPVEFRGAAATGAVQLATNISQALTGGGGGC